MKKKKLGRKIMLIGLLSGVISLVIFIYSIINSLSMNILLEYPYTPLIRLAYLLFFLAIGVFIVGARIQITKNSEVNNESD